MVQVVRVAEAVGESDEFGDGKEGISLEDIP